MDDLNVNALYQTFSFIRKLPTARAPSPCVQLVQKLYLQIPTLLSGYGGDRLEFIVAVFGTFLAARISMRHTVLKDQFPAACS